MYARVVSAQAQLDKLDEAIEICQSMEPAWQQQKGFQGATLLVNRDTGNIHSISTWATRSDLEATVYRVTAQGALETLGTLVPVCPQGFVMIEVGGARLHSDGLPWWIFDMRPQGYLGRAYCQDVRIAVTGGFTAAKIRQFEDLNVPTDIYGVGSWLLNSCDEHGTANDFTADVVRVKIDGHWVDMAKTGRRWCDNLMLERVE